MTPTQTHKVEKQKLDIFIIFTIRLTIYRYQKKIMVSVSVFFLIWNLTRFKD